MSHKQIDYKSVLSLFLPQGILDYFDIVDYSDMGSYYIISLEDHKVIPSEYSHLKLVLKVSYIIASRVGAKKGGVDIHTSFTINMKS